VVADIFNPSVPLGAVQRTDFPTRALALANEIERTRPDLIALQEAAVGGRVAPRPAGAGRAGPLTTISRGWRRARAARPALAARRRQGPRGRRAPERCWLHRGADQPRGDPGARAPERCRSTSLERSDGRLRQQAPRPRPARHVGAGPGVGGGRRPAQRSDDPVRRHTSRLRHPGPRPRCNSCRPASSSMGPPRPRCRS
jgi:hypothetical protein